jgi:hypothetical protein
MMTEYLVYLAERHSLLPHTYFSFRPGRSTTDTLLAVEKFIRDAWEDGEVASGLFLDVKGAFPSVHIPQLAIDLCRKGIPDIIIRWIQKKLDGRRTMLVFDGHRLSPLAIHARLDQGCPLSGILYNFYNAHIGEMAGDDKKKILIPGFADNLAVLVRGSSFYSMRDVMERMFRQEQGISHWQATQNCWFAVDKFALIDFSKKRHTDLDGQTASALEQPKSSQSTVPATWASSSTIGSSGQNSGTSPLHAGQSGWRR